MIRFLFAGAALIATGATFALAQPAPTGTDRSISVGELRQRHTERFNTLDTNKDGQLSQEEMQSGRQGPRMGRGGDGPGFGMRPRGPGGPGGLFQGADANSDGVVTQEEFTAQALNQFRQLDTNRDGRVAADEAQAARQRLGGRFGGRGGGRFAMLDADRDGSVSRAEFDRRFAERIERLDANKDGNITAEERRAGRGRPGARP